jgi:enterochelin esterase-like enzyme
MKKSIVFTLAIMILGIQMSAQNTFTTQSWWKPADPKFSPVVHEDKTITFRLDAPDAKKVALAFDEWDVVQQPMTKDENGIWSITIGPVKPNLYQYTFWVDGLKTIDLVNPDVKAGTMIYGSLVEVPGEIPRFDEEQLVPHGQIHIIKYLSTPLQKLRRIYVYVPSAYFEQPDREFPVLYLRHGGGDNESSWFNDGRAAVILDNLIAKNEAVPMMIVMTNGLTDGSWAGSSSVEGMQQLEEELILDVIPLVEKNYRIAEGKSNRAIAGLSMGGGQAFVIGLRNLDKFSAVGQFSSGILSDNNFDYNAYIPGLMDNPQEVNKNLQLLWISCGTKDPRYQGHLNLVKHLNEKGINIRFHELPYGHEWQFWRIQLHDFAKAIFKQ